MNFQTASDGASPLTLSLVLPCYQEAPHFRDSVARILRALSVVSWTFEIIFVDDGSTDGTRELVREQCERDPRCIAVLHDRNRGRGAAFKTGFARARGRVVGFIDIDLEVDAMYIIPLAHSVLEGTADLATGNRYALVSQSRKLIRWILSTGYGLLTDLTLGSGLQDTETGIKFFDRARCRALIERSAADDWFWDTEVMTRAALDGYRIVEIPVLFLKRHDKKSTVRIFRDVPRYLVALTRFSALLGWDAFDRRAAPLAAWRYETLTRRLGSPAHEAALARVASMIPDGVSVVELGCMTGRLYTTRLRGRVRDYVGIETNGSFVHRMRRDGTPVVYAGRDAPPALRPADFAVCISGLKRFGPQAGAALAALVASARRQSIVIERVSDGQPNPDPSLFSFEELLRLAAEHGAESVSLDKSSWSAVALFEGRPA